MSTDIGKPHPDYSTLETYRMTCRDLMGGTRAMRAAGQRYLPKEHEESDDDYQSRVNRTTLYNGFRRTVLNFAGRVFSKPVVVESTSDDRIIDWSEDVTNDGRDIVTFGLGLAHTGLAEGQAHIFADYTQVSTAETLAEEREMSPRPYLVEIKPKDLIYWRHEVIGGVKALAEIRFLESYVDEDRGERCQQIRVWRYGGEWEIWRRASPSSNSGRDTGWALYANGQATIIEIPFVTIHFGQRFDEMSALPPLEDLADVNVAHWQSSSDQRYVLHIARVPILMLKGFQTESGAPSKVVVGVNRFLRTNNPAADARYVEHSGQAIAAGRQDLQDLEAQMAALGIELLLGNRPGDITATGRAITKAAEESTLQSMAKAVKRGLSDAVSLMAEWAGIDPDTVTVEMDVEHDLVISDGGELASLTSARERGDLTRDTLWKEFVRRGILSDEFDPEAEEAMLDQTGPTFPPSGTSVKRDGTSLGAGDERRVSAGATDEDEEEGGGDGHEGGTE